MARKLTDVEVKHWEQRIGIGTAVLRKRVDRWNRTIDRYANRNLVPLYGGGDDERDEVAVNLVFSNIRAKLPFLYFRNPDLIVRAKNSRPDRERLALVDGLIRYYMGEWDLKAHVNRSILDSLLMWWGVAKIGYGTRTVKSVTPPPRDTSLLTKMKAALPRGRKSSKDTSVTEDWPQVYQEGPTFNRVSSKLIFTHPDARFPLDTGARWMGQISVRSLEEIKFMEHLDKSWRRDVQASRTLDPDTFDLKSGQFDATKNEDPDAAFVVLYEIWDRLRREVLVFAEGNYELGPGRVDDWFFDGMEGYPYEFLVPFEVPDEFEGLNEEDPILNQLEEINRLRTEQIRHLRRARRKYAATSAISQPDKRALQVGEDGLVISVEGDKAEGQVVPIADAPLSFDFYKAIEDVREDLNEISAVNAFRRRGVVGASSATEANIVEEISQARAEFSQDQVTDFVRRCLRKEFQVMQQWLPKELVVEIVGDVPGDRWRPVSPQDIAGEYDIDLVPGSTAPPNKQLMRADAVRLFEMLANSPQVNQEELHRMMLEQFPDLIGVGRLDRLLKKPSEAEALEEQRQPSPADLVDLGRVVGGGGA